MISVVNKIPPILAPKVVKGDVQDDEDDEKVQSKSAQVDLNEAIPKQIEMIWRRYYRKWIYLGQHIGTQLNNGMLAM